MPAGGSRSINKQIYVDEDQRHYWMFKCRVGNTPFRIDKNNAMCNVWRCDHGSKVRFTLRRNESGGIRLNMTLNSGAAYFTMS